MTLKKYLQNRNHSQFAKDTCISKAHLSMILSGARKPSIIVANRIIMETKAAVTLEDLLPDLYKEVMKCAERSKM